MEWQLRVRFWVCKFNILFSVAGEGGEILQCKGRVVPAAAAQLPILVIWLPPAKFPFEQLESVKVLITNLIQGIQQNWRKLGNRLWCKLNRRIDLLV